MDAELERWKAAGQYFDYLGFDIFYRVEGTGSPALLLIHGYPFNSWDWALIWPTLVERFTVIAPDMIGHGLLGQAGRLRVLGARPRRHARGAAAHLDVDSCHVLAHDLGDSVGQELLARYEAGDNAYGAPVIESITWLNGGMFNESYTPRLVQKLMSRTPLGDMVSPVPGQRGVAADHGPHPRRDVRAQHQADAAHARAVPPDHGLQRRRAGDPQGGQVRQRPLPVPQPLGAGHAGDRRADATDRRSHRSQLGTAHGATATSR